MHRFLVTASVAAVCLSFGRAAAPANDVPGLVQEQPASGRFVKTDRGFMVPYKATIPGTEATFEMQPIPGGTIKLGSPDAEPGRKPEEGPQFEVQIEPFWMSTYEVTWHEYKQYMAMHTTFKRLLGEKLWPTTDANRDWVVTAPSSLYDPTFTFKQGADPKQPAVTMSQFAAKQYTKWLSGLTGEYYRLPSEAEWEHACRAGTTTAWFFGDDPAQLGDYAWYYDNASEKTQLVGQKKPNPWGLYDIHGNVGEWCLDQFSREGYKKLADQSAGKPLPWMAAVNWPTKLYPRVIRGGGWDEDAPRLRSAARRGSDDDDWRGEDPNFPQSPWWFTSDPALSVGMRPIRPLNEPATVAEKNKFWEPDINQIREDVDNRINQEGRGSRGVTSPDLPAVIEKLPK
jgi:formylglycine-generating enzyme required for sulfatase activity